MSQKERKLEMSHSCHKISQPIIIINREKRSTSWKLFFFKTNKSLQSYLMLLNRHIGLLLLVTQHLVLSTAFKLRKERNH